MAKKQPTLTTDQIIARNIRALLGIHRMSQVQLAHRIGMDPRNLGQRMNSAAHFRAFEVALIASALSTRIDRLFDANMMADITSCWMVEMPAQTAWSLN